MSEPLRVLLVEDSESDARLLLHELKSAGFTVHSTRVQRAEEMRGALMNGIWDLVLADYRLPAFDGLAALQVLRSYDADMPFILVSGAIGEDAAVDALKAGAQDFVMKERLARLVPAIRRELREAAGRRQQRVLEKKVHESQQRLQSILDHSPALIHVSDLNGRLTLTNRMFDETFGRGTDVLLGRLAAEIFPSDVAETRRQHNEEAIARDGPVTFEESYETGGEARTHLTVSFPLRDTRGEVRAICAIATDVTEQKRLQQQLLQAQKMEALGQLAGGVAHDFNNILAAMMLTTSLLQNERGLPPLVSSGLRQLQTSANRAAALTRQLLISGRREMPQIQVVDLNAIIGRLVEPMKRVVSEAIDVTVARTAQPLWVKADAGMIEQVLTNLCLNARDAMRHGGRLFISVEEHRRVGAPAGVEVFARLTVRDTGCGMDQATLERLYEPFFTTKPTGKGTGLGLSTVYGIVSQHRGWIDVESAVGRGTEFRIHLPVQSGATPSIPTVPQSVGGNGTPVLLVDDEAPVRSMVAMCLKNAGYHVVQATTGEEALACCRASASRFAVLVTDIVMPGSVSGWELARELKATQPELQVVFMTGYNPAQAGAPNRTMSGGAVYLQKPFAADRLLNAVRSAMQGTALHDCTGN